MNNKYLKCFFEENHFRFYVSWEGMEGCTLSRGTPEEEQEVKHKYEMGWNKKAEKDE